MWRHSKDEDFLFRPRQKPEPLTGLTGDRVTAEQVVLEPATRGNLYNEAALRLPLVSHSHLHGRPTLVHHRKEIEKRRRYSKILSGFSGCD